MKKQTHTKINFHFIMDDTALAQSCGCKIIMSMFPFLYTTLEIEMLSFIFKSLQHGRYDRLVDYKPPLAILLAAEKGEKLCQILIDNDG